MTFMTPIILFYEINHKDMIQKTKRHYRKRNRHYGKSSNGNIAKSNDTRVKRGESFPDFKDKNSSSLPDTSWQLLLVQCTL